MLDDSADYSTWKKEVNIWVLGTSAKPTQQASKLIMSMRGKPRDVAINLSPEEIGAEDGLKNLFKELDKLYNKDSTQSLFKAIDEFESYRRPGEADIDKYILEFQRRYKCLKQLRENKDLYEDTILAYRLLHQASLNEEQQRLIKATCVNGLTYDNMQDQLRRTFGDGLVIGNPGSNKKDNTLPYKSSSSMQNMKEEPVFLTDDHYDYEGDTQGGEIYWNSSQGNHNNRPSLRFGAQQDRGRSQGSNFRYRPYGRENHYSNRGNNSNQRGQGFKKARSCFVCGEEDHFMNKCPHNQMKGGDRGRGRDKIYAMFEPDFELPDSEQEIIYLTGETTNKALLDTGACATVCGKEWFRVFEQSLKTEDREDIVTERTVRMFKFGDGNSVKSEVQKTIPVKICGNEMLFKTYIVDNDIPLLLSN